MYCQVHASQAQSKSTAEELSDPVYRTSVEEGARDLAVVEALLESSRQGSAAVPVRNISSVSANQH